MNYVYTGTKSAPKTITLRGVKFPTGEAVVINDPALAAKLDGLDYFEKVAEPEVVEDAQDA